MVPNVVEIVKDLSPNFLHIPTYYRYASACLVMSILVLFMVNNVQLKIKV